MFKRQKSGLRTVLDILSVGLVCFSIVLVPLGFMVNHASAATDYNYVDSSNQEIQGPEGTFKHLSTGFYETSGAAPFCLKTRNGKDGGTTADLYSHCTATPGLQQNPNNQPITILMAQSLTGTWLDHSTISVGASTFRDGSIDEVQKFPIVSGSTDSCDGQNFISISANAADGGTDNSPALIHLWSTPGNGNNTCSEKTFSLNLLDPSFGSVTSNYYLYFVWADSGTISSSDLTTIFFTNANPGTAANTPNNFDGTSGTQGDKNCTSSIEATPGATYGELTLRNNNLSQGWPTDAPAIQDADRPHNDGQGCSSSDPIMVYIGDPMDVAGKKPGSSNLGDTSNGGTASQVTPPTCDASGFSLSWLICPIIKWTSEAADGLFTNFIQPLLNSATVDTNSSNQSKIYTVWSYFRVYGNIFLVLALMVMIFGQAIGGGLLDSYTVKKVAPRLVIAAILINLSIYIVALGVDLANILGGGIYGLITIPVKTGGNFKFVVNGAGGDFGFAALAAAGWGAVAVGGLGIGSLITFLVFFILIPGVLAMVSVLFTLVLRRVILTALIITSPIAFALWCLPNTEQVFKRWWNLLFRTLLVYPIVMLLFAVCNLVAVTINGTAPSFLTQIVSMVAIIIPLFLVPFAFRIAGGTMATMGNMASQLRSRVNNTVGGDRRARFKKRFGDSRAEKRGTWAEKAKEGKTFANPNAPLAGKGNIRSRLARGIQTATLIGAAGTGVGILPWRTKAQLKNARKQRGRHAIEDALQNDPVVKAAHGWDDINRAMHDAPDEATFRRNALMYFRQKDGWEQEETGEFQTDPDTGEQVPIMRDKLDKNGQRIQKWDVDQEGIDKAAETYRYYRKKFAPEEFKQITWRAATEGMTSYDVIKNYVDAAERVEKGEVNADGTPAAYHQGVDMLWDLAEASDGDMTDVAQMIKIVKSLPSRPDQSEVPFSDQLKVIKKIRSKHDDDGSVYTKEKAALELYGPMMQAMPPSLGLGARAKLHAMIPEMLQMRRNIRKAWQTEGTPEERQRAVDAQYDVVLGWLDAAGYAKPEQKAAFGDLIMNWNPEKGDINFTSDELKRLTDTDWEGDKTSTKPGVTVQEGAEKARESEVSSQRRRNYEFLRGKTRKTQAELDAMSEEEIAEEARMQREIQDRMARPPE